MQATKEKYHHGDLRSALLDAALDVISEIGPQGLSIREVARRAGVSHAAPYRHFTDKNELILAVVEQGFALMQQTTLAEKAAADDDAASQFTASGLAYVNFALDHPAYYRIMFSGDLLSSTGHVSLQHTSREALQVMVSDISQCQELGLLRDGDPVIAALTIWSTIHGFVTLTNDNRLDHLMPTTAVRDKIREAILELLFRGLASADFRDN